MLSLTRSCGQSFTIGDCIEIVIFKTRSNKVVLGIDAPEDLPILRDNAVNREKKRKFAEQDRATPEETTRAAQRG